MSQKNTPNCPPGSSTFMAWRVAMGNTRSMSAMMVAQNRSSKNSFLCGAVVAAKAPKLPAAPFAGGIFASVSSTGSCGFCFCLIFSGSRIAV